MDKFSKVISGIFIGLAPLLGASFFIAVIYYEYPESLLGKIICLVLFALSIWAGIGIYKKIQIVGPLEFITAVNASPELDNLELGPDSQTKRREPDELVDLINSNQNLFKSGTIRIFGDWFGDAHDNIQTIKSAEFKKETQILILEFDNNVSMEIEKPEHIFEVSSFLKIINADRITLKWYRKQGENWTTNPYHIVYNRSANKIETETNVDYYNPYLDVSSNATALMIY